jgi:hypothetical protein
LRTTTEGKNHHVDSCALLLPLAQMDEGPGRDACIAL